MPQVPEGVRIEKGAGGLDRLVLSAAEGEAHVFLQGGHVSHFQPKGEKNGAAVTFEEALHPYFAVSDVRQVRIRGLEGVSYLDKTAAMARKPGEAEPIAIAAETDRVYLGTSGPVAIEDPGWHRRIVIGKSGSSTTVVWNPWIAKAKTMPDFGEDEWIEMVCVESANAADDAITLAPGATHVMAATIEVHSSPA